MGSLPRLPSGLIADVIFAHIAGQPLFHGLPLGSSETLNFGAGELTSRSVSPCLTEAGRRDLTKLCAELAAKIEAIY